MNEGNGKNKPLRVIPFCGECEYSKTRLNIVWGDGEKGGIEGVMIIGEAPGADEDRIGIPFVGRTGKLLRETIDKYGIKNYYITNVVKCRPPNNENPIKDSIQKCKKWLDKEIERCKPKAVVMVGSVALGAVILRTGIVKWSGKIVRIVDGVVYLAIVHPSYAIRGKENMELWDKSWKDIYAVLYKMGLAKQKTIAEEFLNSISSGWNSDKSLNSS